MKTINNYISEALVTKSNIKKAVEVNKPTNRFDVDALTEFPKIFDMENSSSAKRLLNDWMDKNNLWPSVDKVDGHRGKWTIMNGTTMKLSYYEIGFHFLEKDLGNFLPFILVKNNGAKVVNRTQELSGMTFNTYDLLNEESKLCMDIYGLTDCLTNIINAK